MIKKNNVCNLQMLTAGFANFLCFILTHTHRYNRLFHLGGHVTLCVCVSSSNTLILECYGIVYQKGMNLDEPEGDRTPATFVIRT